jgi:hypothetical protein
MAKHNAVTAAAESASQALTRFNETETFAQRLFRPSGNKSVQAVIVNGKMHAIFTDGQTTIEIMDGNAAMSVAQSEG